MTENKKTQEIKKRKREKLIIFILLSLLFVLGSTQIYIVKGTTEKPLLSEIAFFILINLNLALLLFLLYLIIRNFSKLIIEYKKGIGSKIKYKLILFFLIFSIVPSILLFFLTSSFISTSIERWFNVQIEKSLNEALKVAKTFYKNTSDNALFHSRRISSYIRQERLLDHDKLKYLADFLRNKKKEYNLESLEVISFLKERLFSEIPENSKPIDLNLNIIEDALNGKENVVIEDTPTGDIVRAVVPIFSTFKADEAVGCVVVSYHIPHSMVNKMEIISETYEKYSKLMFFKKPLKSALFIMLLITTLVIIFTSLWFGLYFARHITEPLEEMTNAVKSVSEDNMDIQVNIESEDEIGTLSKAFNKMLQDLKEKRSIIEAQSKYLKILMNKVSTGILALSPDGSVVTFNEAFKKIFSLDSQDISKDLQKIFYNVEPKEELFKIFATNNMKKQKEVILKLNIKNNEKFLKIDMVPMFDEQKNLIGFVVVFEDITENIRYEKILAWREVARKVAHEIKNPLTPIQLSASRIKKKYEKYISDNEKETFNECIKTIISQVEDIKSLIDEFSNYGKMPSIKKNLNSLNEVMKEIHFLFKETHKNINFEFNIDNNIPPFEFDREYIKRAFINLVSNSIDAIGDKQDGEIKINAYYQSENDNVVISVSDNGIGVKDEYKSRLFEPYFSRKKGGTGLGLYIVYNIIKEHNGEIKLNEQKKEGTEFIIILPTK